MADWIAQNGSSHLKRALAGGYRCQELYLRERAALELPGFEPLQPEKGLERRQVDSPSLEGLDLAEEVGGRVVRLMRYFDEEEKDGSPRMVDLGEAVVVNNWLGRYRMYRLVKQSLPF
ncbi:hypothetical protein D3C87_1702640 [compost metagenome]